MDSWFCWVLSVCHTCSNLAWKYGIKPTKLNLNSLKSMDPIQNFLRTATDSGITLLLVSAKMVLTAHLPIEDANRIESIRRAEATYKLWETPGRGIERYIQTDRFMSAWVKKVYMGALQRLWSFHDVPPPDSSSFLDKAKFELSQSRCDSSCIGTGISFS